MDFQAGQSNPSVPSTRSSKRSAAKQIERDAEMIANACVFVLTDKTSLFPMQAASFSSEDDFQDLLARFPALLAADQRTNKLRRKIVRS